MRFGLRFFAFVDFVVAVAFFTFEPLANIEQLQIEENDFLFDFNQEIFDSIIAKYSTIKKSVRRNELWPAVQK